jgi:energy-converting hydrogenase Eha subunit A
MVGEWASDAIWAAWDAACSEEKPDRFAWTTRAITPTPNDAGTVLPDRMTGTVECDDGSRHPVIVLFGVPAMRSGEIDKAPPSP